MVTTIVLAAFMAILGPCETESSNNCVWDASVQGNGTGSSFIDIDGEATYFIG